MRLITTFTQEEAVKSNPFAFSYFLTMQGIDNECEEKQIGDSELVYRIWIVDEEKVEKAENFLREYLKNPQDPHFTHDYETALRATDIEKTEELEGETSTLPPKKTRFLSPAPYGKLSIAIIILTVLLFLWAHIKKEPTQTPLPGTEQLPVLTPIERTLLYDYPTLLELRDKLVKVEASKSEGNKQEAQQLIKKINTTPIWTGIYNLVVAHLRDKSLPLSYHGKMFEKIKEGQVWRIITPIFLHYDFIHIFFNLLWFILLANQIEFRIGFARYALLILLSAAFSNTCQYLMSGPLFMGLSGVVVALAGFIFARQQVAPWEGYLLNRITLIFLALFVFGVFFLQIAFFFLQITGKFDKSIPIANTAHISGAIIGYLLGRIRFFSLQTNANTIS